MGDRVGSIVFYETSRARVQFPFMRKYFLSDFTVGETFIIVGCLLSAITIPFDYPVKSAPNNFSYAKSDGESENRRCPL